MKTPVIIRYIGIVLLLNAAFMFISAMISLFNGFDTGFYPLLLSFVITALVGSFPLIFIDNTAVITSKEGYVIVIGAWMMSCLVGMLPYLMWGGEFSMVNAWFESMSGFTTTGSTILSDVEAVPRGLLFWRASTHWIGGVGVVLFTLVVLPSISRAKMTLSSVELSTIAKDNFNYNTKKILKVIAVVYVGLTFAETILLMMAGMNWFDAITHSFSTLATGGFSTKNTSVMYFDSVWIEMIIAIFMMAASLHFGVIYTSIIGKSNNILRSEVSRYFIGFMTVAGLAIAADLYFSHTYTNPLDAIRYSFFQVISYGSTTGFASANDAYWPGFSMLVMIFASIQCGAAGSTTGGIKVDRVLLMFKSAKARVLKLQHQNAIIRVKLNKLTQEDSAINAAMLLIACYVVALFVSTLFISLWGYDLLTCFTASVASLGNVGPGFGKVSSLDNMNFFEPPIKIWLTFVMLFGRLEIFGFIHLFMIRSWK